MFTFRFSKIAMAFCLGMLFFGLHFSAGQDNADAAAESDIETDSLDMFKITVNVSEVRLDVVVVDGRGRPVTDLTADDFEIYQDNQPQEVTSSVYISDQTEAAARPAATSREGKDRVNQPPLPETARNKEEIRRTILFVVDNLSMSPQDMYNAKRALKGFVEKQIQPDDLVAIMNTGYGNSVLDMFHTDKRMLLARIEGLYEELAMPDRIYGSQLAAISYGVRALKNMPGRKSLFLLTSEYTVHTPKPRIIDTPDPINYYELYASAYRTIDAPNAAAANAQATAAINAQAAAVSGSPSGAAKTPSPMNYGDLYDSAYSRLADEALRAGVVIHLLETRGLEYYEPSIPSWALPADVYDVFANEGFNPDFPVSQKYERAVEENYSFLNPLPAKTGGILVRNSNFFINGIGQEANNMIAGYYLVSYTPPSDTFDRNVYHRVSVKVKRKGAVVHTREGFYSRPESETDSDETETHPLKDAIFSPFQHPDLNVNVAAGYTKDSKAGYLIRAWIHVDAKDLKMSETGTGARTELEIVCLTSGLNVTTQDLRYLKHTFDIASEKIAWVQEHGIGFSLLLPVKKPGAYTVRAAIQDIGSGRIGTAYQFVEIPDLKKKGLALSDIFMITSAVDFSWMHSDVTKEINKGVFFPVISNDEVRSPALRTYARGDKLQTLTMIYNADTKALARSEIETQSILYKDGVEFMRSDPKPIVSGKTENPNSVPIIQKLTVGKDMAPGRYMLQLLATGKKNGKIKEAAASQTMNFTVIEK